MGQQLLVSSFPDGRRMIRWLLELIAEAAWPPASDEWLKELIR
jgi:hypothetical protein